MYNLVCRLSYGDQLDKTKGHLNNIKDKEQCVCKALLQDDKVDIYEVNEAFLVIFKGKVHTQHSTFAEAKITATGLVQDLKTERQQNKAKLEKKKLELHVRCRKGNNVASVPLTTNDGQTVDVLFDNKDWKTGHALNATISLTRNDCVIIWDSNGTQAFLSCWLVQVKDLDIVNHINGNIYHHWRTNLQAVDPLVNNQNWRLPQRNKSSYIGVCITASNRFKATCCVWNANCKAAMTFNNITKAIEMYNLVLLFQYGAAALINDPAWLNKYLAMLEQDTTTKKIESFLAAKSKTSEYQGVSLTSMQKGCFWYGVAGIRAHGKTTTQNFSVKQTGSEVRAAICYTLFHLTLMATDLTLNFEWMQPVYMHLIATMED